MFLGTLGASLSEIVRASPGRRSLNSSTSYGNKKGKGIVKAGYGEEWNF